MSVHPQSRGQRPFTPCYLGSKGPCLGINLQYLFNRFRMCLSSFVHHPFYCPRNALKTNHTVQECCHRNLISCIERDCLSSPCLGSFIRQFETRKFLHIWRAKVELPQAR